MVSRRDFNFLAAARLLATAIGPAARQGTGGVDRAYVKPEPLAPWAGQIGFALDPPVTEWRATNREGANRLTYDGGGYLLDLEFVHPEPQLLAFQFRLERVDKAQFIVRSYSVKTQIPFIGIYRFWDYRGGPVELMNQFNTYTRGLGSGANYAQTYGANKGIPLVLCADREGNNRFTFGMLDQVEATGLRIDNWSLGLSTRGEGLNFSFEFVKPAAYEIKRTNLVDGAWLDRGDTRLIGRLGPGLRRRLPGRS